MIIDNLQNLFKVNFSRKYQNKPNYLDYILNDIQNRYNIKHTTYNIQYNIFGLSRITSSFTNYRRNS